MSNHTFSTKFVGAVREVLANGCADGNRMTREQVCEALEVEGYTISPDTLRAALADGVFNNAKSAYALFTGRYGGIRELDVEATAKLEADFQAKAAKIRSRIEKAMATRAAKKVAQVVSAQATV